MPTHPRGSSRTVRWQPTVLQAHIYKSHTHEADPGVLVLSPVRRTTDPSNRPPPHCSARDPPTATEGSHPVHAYACREARWWAQGYSTMQSMAKAAVKELGKNCLACVTWYQSPSARCSSAFPRQRPRQPGPQGLTQFSKRSAGQAVWDTTVRHFTS